MGRTLMAQRPHIFLFSVHKDAMDAAVRAFTLDWPEARVSNLLDDSLFAWIREAGGIVPEMYDVFRGLTRHMVGRGAHGIVFTCSAFRQVIDACIKEFELPILKPNDAMIENALDAGSRIAVMATVGPTIPSISVEIEELAAARGQKVELLPYLVDDAFDALASGDAAMPRCMIASLQSGPAASVTAMRSCSRSSPSHALYLRFRQSTPYPSTARRARLWRGCGRW